MNVSYIINITTSDIEVGPFVNVNIEEDLGHLAEGDPNLRSSGSNLVSMVRLDRPPIQIQARPSGSLWLDSGMENDSDIVRLMLIKGSKKDEVKLCTNADLSFVKRLQCTVWRIPADWKWGQDSRRRKATSLTIARLTRTKAGCCTGRATN